VRASTRPLRGRLSMTCFFGIPNPRHPEPTPPKNEIGGRRVEGRTSRTTEI